MARKVAAYAFGVIALYLIVYNYAGFAKDETSAASGGKTLIKAFQGR